MLSAGLDCVDKKEKTFMKHPYEMKDDKAFWKYGTLGNGADSLQQLYEPKWKLSNTSKVLTAGSCFAQYVGRHLKLAGINVIDTEPAPKFLSEEKKASYGYGLYSARYGNIYTVRQLKELLEEVIEGPSVKPVIWKEGDTFYDALRPSVEPDGFSSADILMYHRKVHLSAIEKAVQEADTIVFTLGLTEAWIDKKTGRALPTAPGTIKGQYEPSDVEFKNFTFNEVVEDLRVVHQLAARISGNDKQKWVITVSPVPLAATWTDNHVRVATTYSKSILRAAAGFIADTYEWADYFPSFEIVNNPWSTESPFKANLRNVKDNVVARIMSYFLSQHGIKKDAQQSETRKEEKSENNIPENEENDAVCDEEVLMAFNNKANSEHE